MLFRMGEGEWVDGDGRHLWRIHSSEECAGEFCCVHNPSDHPMRLFPMTLSPDERFLFNRRCPHGHYHPDPDSARYVIDRKIDMWTITGVLEADDAEYIRQEVWDHECCELECCKHPYPRTWIHR